MPLWLDLLRTPMAAPETPALRRLRLAWQALCLAIALTTAAFEPFHRLAGDAAPLSVAGLLLAVLVLGTYYWTRKHRADEAYLAALAGEAQ